LACSNAANHPVLLQQPPASQWCERKTVGCLEQQRSERGENLLLASLPRGGSADAAGQVGGGATTAAAASSTVRAFDRSRPEEAGDRALQEEAVDEGEPGGGSGDVGEPNGWATAAMSQATVWLQEVIEGRERKKVGPWMRVGIGGSHS